ncbi:MULTISPECIES: lysophospholipid acyltransferase family protein [Myxococcus]|uniref:lysophospholipid acyltransferase family protein n=1 Tax=Myxococcus TaxID=32 RepID=UPI001141BC64|nr:lysophospholipid acyltransferase family protein [Myxococcus sp. AB025B]MCK8497285.1 1-acyl-sn-glycerol-3-phosphate acyltransferase [Myxococcus fulvus]
MIRDIVRTAFAGVSAVGLTGAASSAISALSVAGAHREADKLLNLWAQGVLASAGVRHEAVGLEHIPTEGHVVFVCNHQSHYDAPLGLAYLEKHTRFVAKAELFKIPVFGSALRLAGNIPVVRSGSSQDRARLEEAVTALRERVSVLFYAEGTRSEDGRLRPFKKGAATLAIQAGVPVVPMAVSGTRLILPKGGRAVRWGQRVALAVGAPITTQGLTIQDREALTRQLEDAVAQLYSEACRRSGDVPT